MMNLLFEELYASDRYFFMDKLIHKLISCSEVCLVLGIMRISSRLLVSTSTAIVLTAAAIIVILFATNLTTIANAQQEQQQQPTNQTGAIMNRTFQSTMDKFRVQVPEAWIMHIVKN